MDTLTEEKTEAQAYADGIAAGLQAWTVAADFVATVEGEDITLAAYVAEYWPDFIGIDYATKIVADQLDGVNSIGEAWEIYLSDVLAVEFTGKHDGTEWTVTGAEVTVTYGGPSCWIEWNGSARLVVRASWGSDKGYTSVYCAGLADTLESYAEVVQC